MKKIIATAVIGLAFLMNLSLFSAEAAQVNGGRGVGSNNLGYCLITGEERVSQAYCPIGQNKLLNTQSKEMASEQFFLLAAARQRPQDGTGRKNGCNGGTGQTNGNGKQDGTGPGCVDGVRVPDCPFWDEKQENGTNSTSANPSDAPTNSSQTNISASHTEENLSVAQTAYGQQPQNGTGNQYGNGQGYTAANNAQTMVPSNPRNGGQANNQTGTANCGQGNGFRDGRGAGGQREKNTGTCIIN